jgi:hypothetical protein
MSHGRNCFSEKKSQNVYQCLHLINSKIGFQIENTQLKFIPRNCVEEGNHYNKMKSHVLRIIAWLQWQALNRCNMLNEN